MFDFSITVAVTVITLAATFLGAIVSLVKHFKKPDETWRLPLDKLVEELELFKVNSQKKFAELDQAIALLQTDASKIDEVKQWIIRLESSIDAETSKLESKINDLIRVVIENIGGLRK